MASNVLTSLKLEAPSLSKKPDNVLQEINNLFEASPQLALSCKEAFADPKSNAAKIHFIIKATKYDVDSLKNWLAEKLSKSNGETVLSMETSDIGTRLIDALAPIEHALNVSITILRERENIESQSKENTVQASNYVVDFLIRRKHNADDFIEVRVAIVGNVDAGKSTLLGVLTHDLLDNGRGEARAKIFKVCESCYKIHQLNKEFSA